MLTKVQILINALWVVEIFYIFKFLVCYANMFPYTIDFCPCIFNVLAILSYDVAFFFLFFLPGFC